MTGGLEVRSLSAEFGSTSVLSDVTVTVSDGELACLAGPSGSGKSTLLRCIAGLHPTTSGTVVAGGRILDGLRPEKRRIGLVPQDGALFTHLSVARNLAYGLFRRPRTERRRRVAELLELIGLVGLGDRMPYELSGGEQQRVALARALAPAPDVLLLDEPFSGLDPQLRGTLRRQIRTVLTETGTTALLVSHDREEALSLSDQVIVIKDGRIRQAGSPTAVYRSPVDAWVGGFLGDAVLLPGIGDGTTVDCAVGTLTTGTACRGPVQVLIRPEQIQLRTDHPNQRADGVGAEVQSVSYLGRESQVTIRLTDGVVLAARVPASDDAPHRGDLVRVEAVGPVAVFAASADAVPS